MTVWELALLFFVFIPLAILWFRTIMDIFDRPDLSGVQKAVWLFAVVAIPLIGVLGYLFTRPVTDQDRERFEAHQQAAHQQQVIAGYSIAGEIEKLDGLRSSGVITEAEFDRQRSALLA